MPNPVCKKCAQKDKHQHQPNRHFKIHNMFFSQRSIWIFFYMNVLMPPSVSFPVFFFFFSNTEAFSKGQLLRRPSGLKSSPVYISKLKTGSSLGVQWLRLRTPNAGGLGSIPSQGTTSHMLQWRQKIPHATTKTWYREVNKYLKA